MYTILDRTHDFRFLEMRAFRRLRRRFRRRPRPKHRVFRYFRNAVGALFCIFSYPEDADDDFYEITSVKQESFVVETFDEQEEQEEEHDEQEEEQLVLQDQKCVEIQPSKSSVSLVSTPVSQVVLVSESQEQEGIDDEKSEGEITLSSSFYDVSVEVDGNIEVTAEALPEINAYNNMIGEGRLHEQDLDNLLLLSLTTQDYDSNTIQLDAAFAEDFTNLAELPSAMATTTFAQSELPVLDVDQQRLQDVVGIYAGRETLWTSGEAAGFYGSQTGTTIEFGIEELNLPQDITAMLDGIQLESVDFAELINDVTSSAEAPALEQNDGAFEQAEDEDHTIENEVEASSGGIFLENDFNCGYWQIFFGF